MIFTNTGKVQFQDEYEMFYHLFMEIGLGINNNNQYLYDQDTGVELQYKEKYIKATVVPVPIYAGRNDIVFEPARNYHLMTTIMGYYIDKETANGNDIGFVAQYIDDNPDRTKQRIVVKTSRGDICSDFYHNIYLGYIECIFKLSGSFDPDLSNFDILY